MKKIYLVRHAKSSWDDKNLADWERPLNKRGKQDAPLMGKRLAARGIMPDLLVTSHAKRARKTAEKIATEIGYPKDRIVIKEQIYSDGIGGIIKIFTHMDDEVSELMLIGHNPDLTILASGLANKDFVNIPTCGMVCLEFSTSSWNKVSTDNCKLVFFDFPKKNQ